MTTREPSNGVLQAIRRRVSVRGYDPSPVARTDTEALLASAAAVDALSTVPPRVALVSGVDQTRDVLTHFFGSYGLILNTPHLLVGILPSESETARVDLGFVLEHVVLEATSRRLGTCWITGSYDAKRAESAVGLAEGEVAAAVVALGHPSRQRLGRLHNGVVRGLAGARRRKKLGDIAFAERWGRPWSAATSDPVLAEVLESARLAPSAANAQPWRFIVRPEGVLLATVRRAPIDAGIVMAHFTLAAGALGYRGHWELRLGDASVTPAAALPRRAVPVALYVNDGRTGATT
jgi:nitroreductase